MAGSPLSMTMTRKVTSPSGCVPEGVQLTALAGSMVAPKFSRSGSSENVSVLPASTSVAVAVNVSGDPLHRVVRDGRKIWCIVDRQDSNERIVYTAAESGVAGRSGSLQVERGGSYKIEGRRKSQTQLGLVEGDECAIGDWRHAVIQEQRAIGDVGDFDMCYFRPVGWVAP